MDRSLLYFARVLLPHRCCCPPRALHYTTTTTFRAIIITTSSANIKALQHLLSASLSFSFLPLGKLISSGRSINLDWKRSTIHGTTYSSLSSPSAFLITATVFVINLLISRHFPLLLRADRTICQPARELVNQSESVSADEKSSLAATKLLFQQSSTTIDTSDVR